MHRKYSYDTKKYNFYSIIRDIYDIDELDNLHLEKEDLMPNYKLDFKNKSKTKAHQIFYKNLHSIEGSFKNFVAEEISPLFDEDFVYQKTPTFRVQWPNEQAIHYWHYDSDEDHRHPAWEINFQVAITDMLGTSCTWAESVPGLKDFRPMEMNYGEYIAFDGNRCLHGNKTNTTGRTRVSFDFRVIPFSRYSPEKYKNVVSATKNNSFKIGGYYKLFKK